MKTYENYILKLPLFNGCTRYEVIDIMGRIKYHVYKKKKGDYIAYAGDEIEGFIALLDGNIHTTLTYKDNHEMILDVFSAPYIPTPGYIFSSPHYLTANIVAVSDCLILKVDDDEFSEIMHMNKKVMLNFITLQSERIQYLCSRVKEFALLPLKDRIITYMKKKNAPVTSVELMAHRLSVTRPSISRVVSELKKEGIIKRTINGIELVDEDNTKDAL